MIFYHSKVSLIKPPKLHNFFIYFVNVTSTEIYICTHTPVPKQELDYVVISMYAKIRFSRGAFCIVVVDYFDDLITAQLSLINTKTKKEISKLVSDISISFSWFYPIHFWLPWHNQV